MKYWEMVLDPVAIVLIVYFAWFGPRLYKAYKKSIASQGGNLTAGKKLSVVRTVLSEGISTRVRWSGLLVILIGLALLIWEEFLL